MKKILITGAFGYLGGRIARFLSEQGYWLRLAAHEIKHYPAWLTQGEIVNIDLLSQDALDVACKDMDVIIHLASIDATVCALNPEKALLINSLGTLKLLAAAKTAEVKRFMYFSTAHVYGDLKGYIDENKIPRPIQPYAISLKTAEDFIAACHAKKQISAVIFRLSNALGCPDTVAINRWNLVVNDLCRQVVTTQKIVLQTAGTQERDFIAISAVNDAVLHIMTLTEQGLGDGIFNLGGACTLTIAAMAELVAERAQIALGFAPTIIKLSTRPNDFVHHLHYCIDKIKNTGFHLQNNIVSEIDATLQFCQQFFVVNTVKE